jgi:hypothetical protein
MLTRVKFLKIDAEICEWIEREGLASRLSFPEDDLWGCVNLKQITELKYDELLLKFTDSTRKVWINPFNVRQFVETEWPFWKSRDAHSIRVLPDSEFRDLEIIPEVRKKPISKDQLANSSAELQHLKKRVSIRNITRRVNDFGEDRFRSAPKPSTSEIIPGEELNRRIDKSRKTVNAGILLAKVNDSTLRPRVFIPDDGSVKFSRTFRLKTRRSLPILYQIVSISIIVPNIADSFLIRSDQFCEKARTKSICNSYLRTPEEQRDG